MTEKDIVLHNKDILFYISDFLDDDTSIALFQMKRYHYNLFKNNKYRYQIKTFKFKLGYISNGDISEIHNENLVLISNINMYNNITKFVLEPFEITFTTDFLLDYNDTKSYKDTDDIHIKNLDELIDLYFMIYREFENFTNNNIHIVFRDEYERIFDYVFYDGYNNRKNFSNYKKNINIIVDVYNYHYDELENCNKDNDELENCNEDDED